MILFGCIIIIIITWEGASPKQGRGLHLAGQDVAELGERVEQGRVVDAAVEVLDDDVACSGGEPGRTHRRITDPANASIHVDPAASLVRGTGAMHARYAWRYPPPQDCPRLIPGQNRR